MSEYNDDILDHNYDGIQEYDNPMPGWWKAIFVISIVWSGVYVAGISLGYFGTYGTDLRESMSQLEQLRQSYAAKKPPVVVDQAMLLKALDDPEQVLAGSSTYANVCAACHGDKGQGLIGPNLTDDFWLHGGQHTDVYKVISKGVEANGMPPWEAILTPEEMVAVTAYLGSLRGTNPEGAKPPQGEKLDPGTK